MKLFIRGFLFGGLGFVFGCGMADSIQSQKQLDQIQSSNLKLELVSGNLQSGRVGQALPQPLVVRMVNGNKNSIDKNQVVQFAVAEGDAQILGKTEIRPDPDGLASVNVQLGQQASSVKIQASLSAPVLDKTKHQVVFDLAATSPLGPRLVIKDSLANGQRSVVNKVLPIPLSVIAQGEDGAPLPGQTVQFSVAKGSADVHLSSAAPTDETGIASTLLYLGTHAEEIEVTATLILSRGDPAQKTVMFHTTAEADVPITLMFVSGHQNGSGMACTSPNANFPSPLVLKLSDQYGNGVPGRSILIDPDAMSAIETQACDYSKTFETDTNGEVSFILRAGLFAPNQSSARTTVNASMISTQGSGPSTSATLAIAFNAQC